MEKQEFWDGIKALADTHRYSISPGEDFISLSRSTSVLMPRLTFDGERVFLSITIRTSSWDFPGERTDLHDVYSLLAATFLRLMPGELSSLLLDFQAMEFLPDVELYSRMVLPEQPGVAALPFCQRSLEAIDQFLASLRLFDLVLHQRLLKVCPLHEADFFWEDKELGDWAAEILRATGDIEDPNLVRTCKRVKPDWLYFRSLRTGISIVKSRVTAHALKALSESGDSMRLLEAAEATFFKSKITMNAAAKEDIDICRQILSAIGDHLELLIPLENKLVAIGRDHLLVRDSDCSRRTFSEFKMRLIERRKSEEEVLFDGPIYAWAEKIDGGRFEQLARELLEARPEVSHVRPTSITNEPDGGVDLICTWNEVQAMGGAGEEVRTRVVSRKVLVQCKAWKKNIGKSDVLDIRDTLERHGADGILVITTGGLSKSLIDHLRLLSEKGAWTDFWDRSYLETLLSASPDLVARYRDIVWFAGA